MKDKAAPQSKIGPLPRCSLCTGIHWPSTVSEDQGLAELLEAVSFFTMEARADDVGQTGVYGLLLSILSQRHSQKPAELTINLLGHSFGAKVVCAALQRLATKCAVEQKLIANVHFNVVLLQAAFDNNDFEYGQLYGGIVGKISNLRVLVTMSGSDNALSIAYPLAHELEFFHKTNRTAMGFKGPAPGTLVLFADKQKIDVDKIEKITVSSGQNFAAAPPFQSSLVIADLTPLHTARGHAPQPQDKPKDAPLEPGSHSDIYCDEIYSLITRFLY